MNEDAIKILGRQEIIRSSHPYWIWESIQMIPDLLEQCLSSNMRQQIEKVLEKFQKRKIEKIILLGRGSSYFLTLSLRYIFSECTKTPTSCFVTNVLETYPVKHIDKNCAVFFHSTSGKSEGDNRVVEQLNEFGAYTIGVTDNPDSILSEAVDDVIIGPGGAKVELPATRTYAAALMRMAIFAFELGKQQGFHSEVKMYEDVLYSIPELLRETISEIEIKASAYVEAFKNCSAFQVIGFGPNIATADETALSLSQSSGIQALNFEMENYIHGPIQTLTKDMGVIAFAPKGKLQDRMLKAMMAAKEIGARTMVLLPEDHEILPFVDVQIPMPKSVPDLLSPIVYMVPMWQFAYYFSLLGKGGHPDRLSMDKPEFKKAIDYLMK